MQSVSRVPCLASVKLSIWSEHVCSRRTLVRNLVMIWSIYLASKGEPVLLSGFIVRADECHMQQKPLRTTSVYMWLVSRGINAFQAS